MPVNIHTAAPQTISPSATPTMIPPSHEGQRGDDVSGGESLATGMSESERQNVSQVTPQG